MTETSPPTLTCEQFCAELARLMEAEFALLFSLDAENKALELLCGQDIAAGKSLEPRPLDINLLPRGVAALLKQRALRLGGSGGQPDRRNLAELLGVKTVKHILFVPVLETTPYGQLAAMLLRSDPAWKSTDIAAATYRMKELGVLHISFVEQPASSGQKSPARMDTGSLLGLDRIAFTDEEAEAIDAIQEAESAFDEDEIKEPETEPAPADKIDTPWPTPSVPAFTDIEPEPQPEPEPGPSDEQLLVKLQSENEQYRQDLERLLSYVDKLKAQTGAGQPEQSNGRKAELVAELKHENEALRQALEQLERSGVARGNQPGIDTQQAKEELRLALEEVAQLHLQLETAQQALVEAEVGDGADGEGKMPSEKAEVIASIAQELRQPLSSILGYTDLLLGESVGILGALQRSFLERVRSSTDRMDTLIGDLIHISELDKAGVDVVRKAVDLSAVIDDAVNLVREQLQEKRIVLRLDLPRQLPQLQTDRDALQQILFHLLENADAATPAEGEITLRAFVEEEAELGEFVLVQVSDTGGGIPEEDLPRVFSRIYRAQNPIIQGVGDTGVGLTIAETLTQALGGRIWVESEEGVGARFSVLLPIGSERGATEEPPSG